MVIVQALPVSAVLAGPEAGSRAKLSPNRLNQAEPWWQLHSGFGLAAFLKSQSQAVRPGLSVSYIFTLYEHFIFYFYLFLMIYTPITTIPSCVTCLPFQPQWVEWWYSPSFFLSNFLILILTSTTTIRCHAVGGGPDHRLPPPADDNNHDRWQGQVGQQMMDDRNDRCRGWRGRVWRAWNTSKVCFFKFFFHILISTNVFFNSKHIRNSILTLALGKFFHIHFILFGLAIICFH